MRMKICDALDQLYRHQAGILDRIETACALLDRDPADAQIALAKARWEMVRKLRAYQIFKHTEIFDPAIASGSVVHVNRAYRMKVDCVAAGDAFRAYALQWSGCDVTAVWDAYAPAMREMAGHLRAHIAREREQVVDFLAGSARTRKLRDPSAPVR